MHAPISVNSSNPAHLDIIALETLSRVMLVLTVGVESGQLQRHGAAVTSWGRGSSDSWVRGKQHLGVEREGEAPIMARALLQTGRH